jgi:predicted acetyltransferase
MSKVQNFPRTGIGAVARDGLYKFKGALEALCTH